MPRVSALLSDEARRGWDRLCTQNGVTLSAMIEALGLLFDERREFTIVEVVDKAREIDHDRRSRP